MDKISGLTKELAEHRSVKIGGDPYEQIGDIVDAWAKENIYTDMIVTVAVNGEIKTEYLGLNVDGRGFNWVWEYDWYEGERDVRLLGFRPLDLVHCYGLPKGKEVLG